MPNFNDITHANHLMRIGSRRHILDVYRAYAAQDRRAAAQLKRQSRRRKIARLALDICLGAATAIGILAAIGLLATVAS